MPSYTTKVDALLEHVSTFTAEDLIDLAIAALDQAGLDAKTQERVRAMVVNRLLAERAEREVVEMVVGGVQ